MTEPSIGQELSAKEAMSLAICQAKKGWGQVSPNPPVGCVVTDKNNKLVSFSYHKKFGEAHAEVNALEGLSPEVLDGATVFVSLEPCSFVGKTPACADFLSQLPIKTVVYGCKDPNAKVNGMGIAKLEEAGKTCLNIPELEEECKKLIEVFSYNQQNKKVFVALKMASSLDGQIGLQTGESQWISGEESRKHAHSLRVKYDATVVGANTYLIDNPSLNCRLPEYSHIKNKVVILNSDASVLKTLKDSNLAKVRPANSIFICVDEALQNQIYDAGSFNIIPTKTVADKLDISDVCNKLYDHGIHSILVEGGGRVLSSFIEAQLFHKMYNYIAPLIIGSAGGNSWTSGLKIEQMSERIELSKTQKTDLGKDLLIEAWL